MSNIINLDQVDLQDTNNNNSIDITIQKSPLKPRPTIKHIVFAGGGAYGYSAFGALEYLHENGFWNINNTESIHGTSIGAIFGTIISLKYEWKITHDYIIKRPWNKVFDFNMYSIINSFQKRGIFDINIIKNIFKPLFGGLDMPINITMRQLYEITKIDLHLYITNLNEFETINISHKTHPDWEVIDAVYSSAALPILFAPFTKDTIHYLDGGMLCNYPIENCINLGADDETVLGIHRQNINTICNLNDESTIFDYLLFLIYKILKKSIPYVNIKYCHELAISSEPISLYDIYLCTNSIEERERLINNGINTAKIFLQNYS